MTLDLQMQTELPAQAIAAIATVVASLIAAAISFVNLTLNKEQKTSDFRQAWIDGLREDLSSFFACSRAFARASQELKILGPANNATYLAISTVSMGSGLALCSYTPKPSRPDRNSKGAKAGRSATLPERNSAMTRPTPSAVTASRKPPRPSASTTQRSARRCAGRKKTNGWCSMCSPRWPSSNAA